LSNGRPWWVWVAAVTAVTAVTAVMAILAAVAGFLTAREHDAGPPSGGVSTAPAATPRGSGAPTAAAASGCQHYVVTARDLWLRDEHGRPLAAPSSNQLLKGTRITVTDRFDTTGRGYWSVVADDGRSGFVDPDPKYLAPACS
jgi:hypothetical protein